MLTGIDHVVLAVCDLEEASAAFTAAGYRVRGGGRHEGLGTHNALVPMGSAYLELLSVENADVVREHGFPQQRDLANLLSRGRDHLAAYVLGSVDLNRVASSLDALGIDSLGPYPMERHGPGGTHASWRLLVPQGSAIRRWFPYFIQWETPPPRSSRRPPRVDLAGVTVGVPDGRDVERLFMALGATRGRSPHCFDVGPHTVVTSPEDPEGIVSVQLAVDDSVVDLAWPLVT